MKMGTLKPDGYRPRIVDAHLGRLLDLFGAVEVVGTMWSGKTWTSLAFAESITSLAQAGPRLAAEADPTTALLGARPHLIDEWQDVPAIWDEVRDAIDADADAPGSYILTGSSQSAKDKVHHSGAGRIARMPMSTMTLQEMGISSGAVSLTGLFEGSFTPQAAPQHLAPLAEAICKGGWPALLHHNDYAPEYLNAYFDAIFSVSISRRRLSGEESRRVARSLARNYGTAAKLSTIAEDAQIAAPSQKAAAEKVANHLEALRELSVLDELPGWDAPIRSKSRLRVKPKRYFADPSLAASLLQVSPEHLMADGRLFGILFEALAIHDLAVYARMVPGASASPLRYYRDADGLEVDAVIELRDGRWAPVEIKLGSNKIPEAIANLKRLRKKVAANPAARNPEPVFSAVVVGAGDFARYDAQGDAYIIPLTALGV